MCSTDGAHKRSVIMLTRYVAAVVVALWLAPVEAGFKFCPDVASGVGCYDLGDPEVLFGSG
jgi:hypothetical protein